MLKKSIVLFIISSLSIALIAFSFVFDMQSFIDPLFVNKQRVDSSENKEVSQYFLQSGSVRKKSREKNKETLLLKEGSLSHQDTIRLDHGSQLQLNFPDGTEIKLLENTKAMIERWNPNDLQSPIYLTLLYGDYELLKEGTRGKVYIVQDKQLFIPSQKPKKNYFSLHLKNSDIQFLRPTNQDSSHAETVPSKIENKQKNDSGNLENTSLGNKNSGIPETLTNAYIEEVIGGERKRFQACQANAIRDQGPVKGDILIAFTLMGKGKIEKVKVLQTSIDNPQLLDCLATVFKNLNFQPFRGESIYRSYPLAFE